MNERKWDVHWVIAGRLSVCIVPVICNCSLWNRPSRCEWLSNHLMILMACSAASTSSNKSLSTLPTTRLICGNHEQKLTHKYKSQQYLIRPETLMIVFSEVSGILTQVTDASLLLIPIFKFSTKKELPNTETALPKAK